MVIDAELGRRDHGSIPAAAIGRGLEPLDVRTDTQTRLNWWCKYKKKAPNILIFTTKYEGSKKYAGNIVVVNIDREVLRLHMI
jgi:hypothetical protein